MSNKTQIPATSNHRSNHHTSKEQSKPTHKQKEEVSSVLNDNGFVKKFIRPPLFVFILLFAIGGSIMLLTTHATSPPTASVEPEQGTAGGSATTGSDATASNGQYVKFGAASSPSGVSMPTGDIPAAGGNPGWKLLVSDDFTKDAVLGSWGSACDGSHIDYVGATGTQWRSYPTCYNDTYQGRPYRSDAVLSVSGGVLDFWLHNVGGQPAGANPSPIISGASQYQTYGRYTARIKIKLDPGSPPLSNYYAAWLLWPQNDADGSCVESDFPEGRLNSSVSGFAHNYPTCPNSDPNAYATQDSINGSVGGVPTLFSDWHTYTQEWTPTYRKYYVDGNLVGTSTTRVSSENQRWQLQTETNCTSCDSTQSGHLMVDWVAVYGYSP